MKKDKSTTVVGVLGILMWIGLTAAHIYTAVVVYGSVKLWAFLVILLVPGFGDLMGVYVLFKIKFFFPLIVYAASIVLYFVVAMIGNKMEKNIREKNSLSE